MTTLQGLFITGSGTEVGKTYVAAQIAKQLVATQQRVGVYKPVASGCIQQQNLLISEDAMTLWQAAGEPQTLEQVCPQRFLAPLSPHRAARAEGQRVDPHKLREGLKAWRAGYDFVLVEGAGGLMSPLSDEDHNADLAADFGLPLLIVVPNRLGVINDTLQTVITAEAKGLTLAGVVLNDVTPEADQSRASNAEDLTDRLGNQFLGCVGWGTGFDREIDWLNRS